MLDRIANLTWNHPRKILAAALLFAAVAGFFGHDVEHHLKAAGFTDPSSESEQAGDVLAGALGHSAQPGLTVLVRPKGGGQLDVQDPAVAGEIDRLVTQLGKADYVGHVDKIPAPDGKSLALAAQLSTNDFEDKGGLADESVRKLVASKSLDLGYGGYAPSFNEVNDQTRKDLTNAELIAFPILALLLLLVFRSAVAAALPLLIGALSIVGTLFMLRVMSSFVGTSVFALNIGTALSLGLAVDYALLLVSRHREETAKVGFTREAHTAMMATAGRTALFSGLTVAGAMAALMVMPQRFLYSVGAAGAMVGVLSAVMAIFVAPALLAVLGPRINAFSIRSGPAVSDTSTRWLAVARGVMRRPLLVALVTASAVLALASPLFATHLTGPSAQAVPPGQQSYDVNKYLFDHYPREVTEGVSLTVRGTTSDAALAELRTKIADVPGMAQVSPFQHASSDVAFATASLDKYALSDESQQAVRDVRALPDPEGGHLLVAGNTASFLDEKSSLVSNAPLAIGLIVLLTVVLLFLLTGSVLLPLKTLLMNTMTLAAALGILVIVFEKKFLVGLLDYPGPYSVEVTSLVFLFAVTFALATDYAVLVMARIKELRDSGMTNEDAVAHGVARTGRIISAAAIMIAVVFAAFAVSPVFFMKQIAVGMSLGVIIDATVVRAFLVPSLMRLLGEANWWAPGPLRRLHARFGVSH
ncbi:MMPL family transporter [Nocardioides marmorisolisilvae]|uniref:MMPL family transporter n=1 Tax=Nocardioides marmorisolisilvae TaxID=1542737 RepID=A0A3N0DZZ1_9ACTN|nr:MMPL family transporter [Nocardioides marmorisolisilvae]RNL81086.1 MMPL family transporter [Nocardioides marmorisolisilvae]